MHTLIKPSEQGLRIVIMWISGVTSAQVPCENISTIRRRLEPAETKDWDLEAAFNYSIKSEYMIHDTVQGRIARAMKTINFHKDGKKR